MSGYPPLFKTVPARIGTRLEHEDMMAERMGPRSFPRRSVWCWGKARGLSPWGWMRHLVWWVVLVFTHDFLGAWYTWLDPEGWPRFDHYTHLRPPFETWWNMKLSLIWLETCCETWGRQDRWIVCLGDLSGSLSIFITGNLLLCSLYWHGFLA